MDRSLQLHIVFATLFLFVAGVGFALNSWDISRYAAVLCVLGVAVYVLFVSFKDVRELATPKSVFWAGLVYTIVLNPAMGSEEINSYPSTALTTALLLTALFAFCAFVGATFGRQGKGVVRFDRLIPSLSPTVVLAAIFLIFCAELARRLYFVGWDIDELIYDTLLARSGEVRFGRDQFGDWRVFIEPISIIAGWLPCVVGFYWMKETRPFLRLLALVPALLVMVSAFFGGSRGTLAVPIGAFLAFGLICTPRHIAKRYVIAAFVLATVLAPLMDLMVEYRGVGWHDGVQVKSLVANPLEAKRDTNFEALTGLVEVVPAVEPYRSPFELYYFLAIAPIPRVLWPGKPYMSQDYLGEARPYYASISIVGDLYFYGGWLHVIVGGLAFGIAMRWLGRAYDAARQRPEVAIFYILNLVAMVSALRALWSLVTAMVIQACFVFLIVVLAKFQGKRRSRDPRMSLRPERR